MLREKPTGTIKTAYDHDNEPYLFEATGKEAKHFCDILRAEDDGRLVILPCKVGTVIWRVWYGEIYRYVVVEVDAQDHVKLRFLIECLPYLRFYWDDEYGKTVFLTRAEAEAALKGEKDDV